MRYGPIKDLELIVTWLDEWLKWSQMISALHDIAQSSSSLWLKLWLSKAQG
jgi:hypothetical protein